MDRRWEKSRGWNKIHRVLRTIVDENANVANRPAIGLRELLADSKAATVWLNLNIESSLKRDGIYFPSCGLINKNNRSNRINLHRREKRSPLTHPRGWGGGRNDRDDRGGVEDGSVSILTRAMSRSFEITNARSPLYQNNHRRITASGEEKYLKACDNRWGGGRV